MRAGESPSERQFVYLFSFTHISYYYKYNYTSLGPNQSPEKQKWICIIHDWCILGFDLVNHICQYLCSLPLWNFNHHRNSFIIYCLCSSNTNGIRWYWFAEDVLNQKHFQFFSVILQHLTCVSEQQTTQIFSTTKNVLVNQVFFCFVDNMTITCVRVVDLNVIQLITWSQSLTNATDGVL